MSLPIPFQFRFRGSCLYLKSLFSAFFFSFSRSSPSSLLHSLPLSSPCPPFPQKVCIPSPPPVLRSAQTFARSLSDHLFSLSLLLYSVPDPVLPHSGPRHSFSGNKSPKVQFPRLPTGLSLSPCIMLSANNFKQGSTSTTERRISAPPISRPAVFSPSSLPITQAELPQSRPRSNSQVQTPLYSPTTFAWPLPALPISPTNAEGRYGRDVNVIKVPVQEGADVNVDGEVGSLQTSLPSPHILNSNRLHPSNQVYGYGYGYSNSLHPHSPQLIPKDFPYSSQVQQQQGQLSSSSLEYRSSVSSSNSNSHPNANKPPSDLHNEVYRPRRHLDVPGRQSSSEDMNQSLYQKTANESTGALKTSRVEPPQQHYPTNHLSQNDTAIPMKQQPSPACLSSFTSCLAESSSVAGLPRLHDLDTSPSSPRSTVEYNSGDMSSLTSSSPIHSEYPVHLPSDLQPYCPPPPPLGNARSVVPPWHQGHSEGNPISSTFTAQTPASAPLPLPASAVTPAFIPPPPNMMAASKTTTLAPNHSNRRHSSGAQELFIKTKHLHSIKPGPSTADVSSSTTTSTRTTTSRNRYLDPEVSAKGSSRNTSRTRQPSPSRPSTNHLDIPRLQQQIQSQQQQQQQQQQQTHYSHHSEHHQHPVSPQNKVSTLRSPNSSRTASPASSGFLETFQDCTAMALMQRYLMCPGDPDSEADTAMQIMISQAAVDSKGFEILVPQTVERIKRVRVIESFPGDTNSHHASPSLLLKNAKLTMLWRIRTKAELRLCQTFLLSVDPVTCIYLINNSSIYCWNHIRANSTMRHSAPGSLHSLPGCHWNPRSVKRLNLF